MLLSRPHQCVTSEMQPENDGCPCVPRPHSRSKVTAGSKVIDSRITPESVSWFMLMLLRYCEDLVPLQTTVYLPVLNFSGGNRCSVHTNEDGFVRQRVFWFFFVLLLIKSGALESQNYLYCACRNTHTGFSCLIINRGFRIKTVTYGCVCLLRSLSSLFSPLGLFLNTYLHEFPCVSATKLQRFDSVHLENVYYWINQWDAEWDWLTGHDATLNRGLETIR